MFKQSKIFVLFFLCISLLESNIYPSNGMTIGDNTNGGAIIFGGWGSPIYCFGDLKPGELSVVEINRVESSKPLDAANAEIVPNDGSVTQLPAE